MLAQLNFDELVRNTTARNKIDQLCEDDNKFVKTAIQKEIETMFKDKVTQNQIGEITKAVIKKLYRELSYSSVHIVDRIKL